MGLIRETIFVSTTIILLIDQNITQRSMKSVQCHHPHPFHTPYPFYSLHPRLFYCHYPRPILLGGDTELFCAYYLYGIKIHKRDMRKLLKNEMIFFPTFSEFNPSCIIVLVSQIIFQHMQVWVQFFPFRNPGTKNV